MPAWVMLLGDASKEEVPLAGGKGTSLGEMIRAGLPVPPGFVLTTEAYRAFVDTYGLEEEIERLANAAQMENSRSVEATSAAIRELFEQKAIPETIARSIVEAYASLGHGAVAVRSSATAEDLPQSSFAGQQESYLNVEGGEAVLSAVRRCWSSLWTARAIAYRHREGIQPADVSIAVVVQQLVPAEISGVMFTVNPVSGCRDQIVVDAAWGLGEAIVSGQVSPDHWVLDQFTGAVLEARLGRKEVMTVRTERGTTMRPVEPADQERSTLKTADLAGLADLGRLAQTHFKAPQDIEWAIAEGRLYLLQSRPITSLYPLPAPAPSPGDGLRVYMCANILQGFPEPLTPAGIAAFRRLSRGLALLLGNRLSPGEAPAAFTVAGGRMYIDATAALRHPRTRVAVLAVPGILDRPMSDILRLLLRREPSLSPPNPKFPFKPPMGLVPRIALRITVTLLAPDLGRRMTMSAADGYVRRLDDQAARLRGIGERVQFMEGEGVLLFPRIMLTVMAPVVAPAMAARFLTESKLRKWLGDATGLQPVLRSLPHNPTTEMDLALWRVAQRLKEEGNLPSADHPDVKEFLARYGHRGVREIDIGMPRWQDDPAPVLETLRNYLSHGEESDPLAHFRNGALEAERAASDLVAEVRQKKGFLRAALLGFLISRIRALLGMREFPKFTAVRLLTVFRRVVEGVGKELVEGGRLDRVEDVFFLDLRDIESNRDLRAEAQEKRAEYQHEMKRRAVPRVMTSTGEAFYDVAQTREGALVGTPASPGVYEGLVRVIRDPRGAHLERGEVLVAPGTDPAWTPLFLTAGALVMEIGGIMSHGSVVAREYGIPAVVGVAAATERLKTGQRIRVDGESGQVVVLDVPPGTLI